MIFSIGLNIDQSFIKICYEFFLLAYVLINYSFSRWFLLDAHAIVLKNSMF